MKSSRTMAVFWRLVRMAPMPAKTPHLFCDVGSMPKHFLDAAGGTLGSDRAAARHHLHEGI